MVVSGRGHDADSTRSEGLTMTDQNTPENPDVTPTQAIELAGPQPVSPDPTSTEGATAEPEQEPDRAGGRHTRTILEIVGAAAAVVLIAAAAAGGFAAGLAVSDDGPRGLDVERMAQEWSGGDGMRGDRGMDGDRGFGGGRQHGHDGGEWGRG